jgi:hypothetical protein
MLDMTHWNFIVNGSRRRLQISSLSFLQICDTSLTGSIPQEVRESVPKRHQLGLAVGELVLPYTLVDFSMLFGEQVCNRMNNGEDAYVNCTNVGCENDCCSCW